MTDLAATVTALSARVARLERRLSAAEYTPAVYAVAMEFGVRPSSIAGDRDRTAATIRARFAAALLMRRQGLSYPAIGHALDRDHSVAMRACQRGEALLASDDDFRKRFEAAADLCAGE